MKARFQILEFPTCLFQNDKLKRETKPSRVSNTGKVLDRKTVFSFNGWEVISVEGSGIPDARVEYLYLTFQQAQILEQVGIKLKMMNTHDSWEEFHQQDMEYWKFKQREHILYLTDVLGSTVVKTAHFTDGTTGEWWVKDGYCKFGWPDPSRTKTNKYGVLDPMSCEYKLR